MIRDSPAKRAWLKAMRTAPFAVLMLILSLGASPAAAEQYWYYCDPAHAYYPYVTTCKAPWRAVVPFSVPSTTTEHPATSTPIPLTRPATSGTPTPAERSTPTPALAPTQEAAPVSAPEPGPTAAPATRTDDGHEAAAEHSASTVPTVEPADRSNEDGDDGTWGVIAAIIVAALVLLWIGARRKRFQSLLEKYGSAEVAKDIMRHRIWEGMTTEQLVDSQGSPVDIDQEIYKRTTRETFKYDQAGRNRFRTRVYVENGVVVGWKTW